MSTSIRAANKELQVKLRTMVDRQGLTAVSRRLDIGREALARYLADLELQTATFLGIETAIERAPIDPPLELDWDGGR
jgi:hypothetical protein